MARSTTMSHLSDDDNASDAEQYDPEQPMAERRQLQRAMRKLIAQTTEQRDKFFEPKSTMFTEVLDESARLIKQVQQTADATIDARFILQVSELSYKRSQAFSKNNVNGVDVDEFVSKCITYMRQGRGFDDDNAPELSSTQRQRRVRTDRGAFGEEDEVGDEGDMLNWAHLGRFACVPHTRRPALSGFLMGPLSMEKKIRKVSKRTARLRINNLREVRPEVLRVEDMSKSEKSDLPALCNKILTRLNIVQQQAQERVEHESVDMVEEDDIRKLMYQYGLRRDGGVDFFKFVWNPLSFGQTAENLFYLSFLIRDGKVAITYDEDELPSLYPIVPEGEETAGGHKRSTMKHQAILGLDMAMWREITVKFHITEPMIPHREEEDVRGPGARGWYS